MARHMDRELHARWRQRLDRQRQGSLTVAEFCEREGISTATFYAWRRKLQGSACPPAKAAAVRTAPQRARAQPATTWPVREPASAFVQVPLAAPPSSPWIEIVLAEGAVIRLPQQNLAALQAVLQSLHGSTSPSCEVRRA